MTDIAELERQLKLYGGAIDHDLIERALPALLSRLRTLEEKSDAEMLRAKLTKEQMSSVDLCGECSTKNLCETSRWCKIFGKTTPPHRIILEPFIGPDQIDEMLKKIAEAVYLNWRGHTREDAYRIVFQSIGKKSPL